MGFILIQLFRWCQNSGLFHYISVVALDRSMMQYDKFISKMIAHVFQQFLKFNAQGDEQGIDEQKQGILL